MPRVAVSPQLSQIKEALLREGMQVVDLEKSSKLTGEYTAIIVSGGSDNFMGMQDTITEMPVINAEGRSAEEIVSAVKKIEHKKA